MIKDKNEIINTIYIKVNETYYFRIEASEKIAISKSNLYTLTSAVNEYVANFELNSK